MGGLLAAFVDHLHAQEFLAIRSGVVHFHLKCIGVDLYFLRFPLFVARSDRIRLLRHD